MSNFEIILPFFVHWRSLLEYCGRLQELAKKATSTVALTIFYYLESADQSLA